MLKNSWSSGKIAKLVYVKNADLYLMVQTTLNKAKNIQITHRHDGKKGELHVLANVQL